MKTIFLVFALLAAAAVGDAQNSDPQQTKGAVFPQKNSSYNFNTGGFPAAVAAQLKPVLEKVRGIVSQAGLLTPPVGFNAVYNTFDLPIPAVIPWQKTVPSVIDFGLPEFYTDRSTDSIRPGVEAFADIDIEINSFRRLYDDTYSRDIEAAGYPCPIFFFRYQQQKDSIRVITNGKPVYVPFTQEQYLNFQIQYNKKTADGLMKSYVHDSVTIANIPAKKEILSAEMNTIGTWRLRQVRHRRQLDSLSADQRKQPAYIVLGGNSPDDLQELTTSDDSRAQELWTINPDYFSKNLPSTAVQLIVVKTEYHPHMASAFIKAKVMDIYRQLDYKALEALIQR